jgi:hypothetical protein
VSPIVRRLREWSWDWLGRSDVKPSKSSFDNPLTILQRTAATLAGIVAILSNPAITVIAPNLGPAATTTVHVAVALVTLAAVNYVVTAKETVESTSGFASVTFRKYRFSNTERLVARGVTGIAIFLTLLSFFPSPKDCDLTATVTWQQPSKKPLFLLLTLRTGGETYPVETRQPVAIRVPSGNISSFSISLVWADGEPSNFGEFTGCAALVTRKSRDDRAEISLASR